MSIDLTESFGLEVPWTAEDAAALRHFLGTTTGKRFLGQLFIRTPKASERSDAFKRGVQSGVQEGFSELTYAIGVLADSTKSVTKPTPNAAIKA